METQSDIQILSDFFISLCTSLNNNVKLEHRSDKSGCGSLIKHRIKAIMAPSDIMLL